MIIADTTKQRKYNNNILILLLLLLFSLFAASFYFISTENRNDRAYNNYINLLTRQSLGINRYVHFLKIGMVDFEYASPTEIDGLNGIISDRYKYLIYPYKYINKADNNETFIDIRKYPEILDAVEKSYMSWQILIDLSPPAEASLSDKFDIMESRLQKTNDSLNDAVIKVQEQIHKSRSFYKQIQAGILGAALLIFSLLLIFIQLKIFMPMKEVMGQLKKAHQNTESSRLFLKTIIDNIADPIFVKNEKHEWIMGNKAFWELMNGEEKDFLGRSDYDVFPKEQADSFWSKDDIVIEDKKVIVTEEILTRPVGGDILINTKKAPFILPNGLVGLVGVIRDVTKERQLEKEIKDHRDNLQVKIDEQTKDLIEALRKSEEAARVKGEFLANMSHEIRTPLNGVIGMADILMDTSLNNEQRRLIDIIHTSGTALLRIINDILDVSKIEAGKITLEDADFNLHYAIEDVIDLMTFRAIDQGIDMLLDLDGDVPEFTRGDIGRIKQILINLIGNAIKFTKEGHVILRVKSEIRKNKSYKILFDIEDTGIGIPKDKLEHIFDKFTQADRTTTRIFGGTGLGLSICKSLIEMMNGKISVKSREGKGSVFSFSIILQPATKTYDSYIGTTADIRNIKVLVVDDIKINRTIVSGQLSTWGIKHETASDGETAYRLICEAAESDKSRFDIILIDQHLPDTTGIELAAKIKNNLRLVKTGLIMFSSFSSGEAISDIKLKEAGFHGHLSKPANPLRLKNILAQTKGAIDTGDISFYAARRIRLSDEERFERRKAKPPIDKERNSSIRVLLADDMKINIMLAERILKEMGLTVETAENGKQALDMHLAKPYDIIFMDCHMPEMNGYDSTIAIRRNEQENKLKTVPIIALTADAMQENKDKCLSCGMSDYITKPIKKDYLIDTAQNWISQISDNNT